jgi:hypothetical protein
MRLGSTGTRLDGERTGMGEIGDECAIRVLLGAFVR